MAAILIENGYEIFTDSTGKPLENGYILIGEYGLNPISNPKQAYWDEDLTIPAANIRTSFGYPVYNGSPGRLYTNGAYSIIVQDKFQNTVYTQLEATPADETVYGEAINSDLGDILYLDGSPSLKTSKGVLPEETYDEAVYEPSQVQSGDELVDNTDVKYPGRRGAWDVSSGNLTYDITLVNSGFTLELWAKGNADGVIFALSNGTDTTNRIEVSASGGNLTLDTTTTGTGSSLAAGWNYIKLVAKNDFNIDVYLDSVLDIADQSLGTSDYTNLLFLSLGNNLIFDTGTNWTGLLTDCRYAPYVDTTTTHFDNLVPWIDDKAVYGENGIYKLNEEVGILEPVPNPNWVDFLQFVYPVGSTYVQYPAADSNVDADEFPVSERPATLFGGGTWEEQWPTESIYFRTRGTLSDTDRTNGFQDDAFQGWVNYSGYGRDTGAAAGIYGLIGPADTPGSATFVPSLVAGTPDRQIINSGPKDDGTNGTPRTATETRVRNRRIKVWKRTA